MKWFEMASSGLYFAGSGLVVRVLERVLGYLVRVGRAFRCLEHSVCIPLRPCFSFDLLFTTLAFAASVTSLANGRRFSVPLFDVLHTFLWYNEHCCRRDTCVALVRCRMPCLC